jgi:hypothetical protein
MHLLFDFVSQGRIRQVGKSMVTYRAREVHVDYPMQVSIGTAASNQPLVTVSK